MEMKGAIPFTEHLLGNECNDRPVTNTYVEETVGDGVLSLADQKYEISHCGI